MPKPPSYNPNHDKTQSVTGSAGSLTHLDADRRIMEAARHLNITGRTPLSAPKSAREGNIEPNLLANIEEMINTCFEKAMTAALSAKDDLKEVKRQGEKIMAQS